MTVTHLFDKDGKKKKFSELKVAHFLIGGPSLIFVGLLMILFLPLFIAYKTVKVFDT